jgi:hypothetical protein
VSTSSFFGVLSGFFAMSSRLLGVVGACRFVICGGGFVFMPERDVRDVAIGLCAARAHHENDHPDKEQEQHKKHPAIGELA